MTSFAYYLEEDILTSLLLTLFSGIPSGALGVVGYVLSSMALYTMAQRRQIHNAWMAWVPVLNCWILGSLSDQYQYVVKGRIKSKRKWLIGLNVASFILSMISLIWTASIIFTTFRYGEYAPSFLGSMLRVLLVALPMAIAGVVATVLRYIALYDVYLSVDSSNAVVFVVLSILFRIVEPFLLFFNREKDTGMPPRQEVPHPPVWEQENKDYL